jgi:hypothetical protein
MRPLCFFRDIRRSKAAERLRADAVHLWYLAALAKVNTTRSLREEEVAAFALRRCDPKTNSQSPTWRIVAPVCA